MKNYEVEINNKIYNVSVKEVESNASTDTNSKLNNATPQPQSEPDQPTPVPTQPSTGEGTEVTAPMAGSIYKISVSPGDTVVQGDTLIVLEAMKMENEIVAPEDGVVGEILVTTNERVQSGQVLLTL